MPLDRSRGNSQRLAYLGVRAAPAYWVKDLQFSRGQASDDRRWQTEFRHSRTDFTPASQCRVIT